MSAIGSASWRGAENYEEGDELHSRATTFLDSVNWDTLTAIASEQRGGVKCQLSEEYSLGHFNLVRRIVFDDEVSWVARLRLPLLQNFFGDREALDVRSSMNIEIATTKYLRQKTTISVPEIFGFDLDPKNAVGAPYMLLEYIPGNVALELAQARECDNGVFGNATQNEKFWKTVADIHAQLASITFDQIGSIYLNDGNFEIGPEIETGKGPWKTSEEYYADLAEHVLETAKKDAAPEVAERDSFKLPTLFPAVMRRHGNARQRGPFHLVNRDFGAHNILVNDDFEIIAIIDLDGVMAAPVEYVAQLPLFMGMNPPAPGHIETRPLFVMRMDNERHLYPRYAKLFREAAAGVRSGLDDVADCMLSHAASVVQGLIKYGAHQGWINDIWFASYERLMASEPVEVTGIAKR